MAPSLPSSPPGSRVTPLDPRRTMAPPAPMSVRTQDEEPRSPEQGNMHEAPLPDRGVTDGQGCPAPPRLRPASCAPGPQLDPKHREVEEQAQDRQTDGRGERLGLLFLHSSILGVKAALAGGGGKRAMSEDALSKSPAGL